MESYLYSDLYELEETHWWHIAKRELIVELIRQKIYAQKPLKILDVGCGTGKNIEALAQFGEVWGIDSSPEAIFFCHRRGLTRVRLGNSQSTHFPPVLFDLVTMLDVLEHVEETLTLTEIRRILKPRGYLLITVPAFSFLWSRWDEVLHHKRRYTQGSLHEVLARNGFKIVRSSYVYSFLVVPALGVRIWKSVRYRGRAYPSDFQAGSPFGNWILGRLATFERIIMKSITLTIGTSIVCLAQKAKK